MSESTLHSAIAAATVAAADFADTARFILYPKAGTDVPQLIAAIEDRLEQFSANATVDLCVAPTVVVVTLPGLAITDEQAAFDAAYLLVDEWTLDSAEPEIFTDFFSDGSDADSMPIVEIEGAEDEGLADLCWAKDDPRVELKPQWALDMMRVPEAWAYSTALGRPAFGAGIIIAQPDTGITEHPELRDIPRKAAIDLISGTATALDPLDYAGNPAHGTGTGSVMLSRSPGRVMGSAPGADHMPIRAIQHVVRVSQLRVAEAINHAVDNGAHVITMSLGGLPSLVLARALRRAVDANLIVLAAAGNCVRMVVWPARYNDCIAVAGVNFDELPWRGSCRGNAVTVSAPGENVLKAATSMNAGILGYSVAQGQGTSFAVALTAGVAALWLAHHGRESVISEAVNRRETVQQLFKRLLMATARRPQGEWDEFGMGPGIVDACALLQAPFDAGEELESLSESGDQVNDESIRSMLIEAGVDASRMPPDDFGLFGMELANLALDARRSCSMSPESKESALIGQVSQRMRARLPAKMIADIAGSRT